MTKLRIAIISNDDKLWSLYAWNNVFDSQLFTKDYECVGFWTCNQKFSNKRKFDVWKWYLTTFRFLNFIKLVCFAVTFKVISFIKSLGGKYQLSFTSLCKAHNIPYYRTPLPNDPDFISWVKANNIDVLLIMVDHILKKEIINAPNICVVNKHASLLPANKGLFPFFWAKIGGEPQGISFHKVNEAIDKGDVYYQEKVDNPKLIRSMIAFYLYVHRDYCRMLSITLKNITAPTTITLDENLPASYHSLPAAKDYPLFKKNGGKIITWGEIFLPFSLFKKN